MTISNFALIFCYVAKTFIHFNTFKYVLGPLYPYMHYIFLVPNEIRLERPELSYIIVRVCLFEKVIHVASAHWLHHLHSTCRQISQIGLFGKWCWWWVASACVFVRIGLFLLYLHINSLCVECMCTSHAQEKQPFSKLPQLFPLILPFVQVSQPLAPCDHTVRVYFDAIFN